MKIFDKNYIKDYQNNDMKTFKYGVDRRSVGKRYLKKHLSKFRRRISKLFLKIETKFQ